MNVSTNCRVMIPESHCKEFYRIETQENRAMRNKINSATKPNSVKGKLVTEPKSALVAKIAENGSELPKVP